MLGVVSALGAALLSSAPRPAAAAVPFLIIAAVGAATSGATRGRRALQVIVGLAPSIVVVGAAQDLIGRELPAPVIALALAGTWSWAARVLGGPVARTVQGRGALRDVTLRMLAVGAVTAGMAGAMVRLLLPDSTAVERLSWILGEEDNAHVVGVAREVLTEGPRGAALADQFGSAFANVPLLLTRVTGGLPAADQDPRLQAVALFTVSTLVVILLSGLAMALLASLPHHVHRRSTDRSISLTTSLLGAAGTTVAAAIGMSLLVVLPMRTGFLTFVWGLALVILGAAVAAVLPPSAPTRTRAVLLVHLLGLVVLLLSSWPFVLPALGALFLIPLAWIRWGAVAASVRRNRGRWAAGASVAILLLAGLAVLFREWGPAAEVLSYGVEILTASASGIGADDIMRRAAFAAIGVAAVAVVTSTRTSAALPLMVAILGPLAGVGLLYLGLRAAAALLTGGELNYAGIKLLFGIIVLASILSLLTILSQAATRGAVATAGATALVALLVWVSPTAALFTDWWARTDLGAPPHVRATVDAIGRTNAELPIRCLPAPGTVVTGTSRLAAYMCVRWMEDAFNEGRFQGHRDDLLTAEGETFEATVLRIEQESMSEYLFAHRFTMGPGWFGWNGADR